MSERRLPGGGKPWFVRLRSRGRYKINPCSAEGWWVVIGYCLFVSVFPSLVLMTGGESPSPARWIAFALLIVAPTVIFLVTLFRMSLPFEDREKMK
jgi:hypothetical protein